MRDILESVANGDISPAAAEAQLRGYVTGDAGRFDAAREQRSGIPEAVLADGKTPDEVASLVATSLDATGRAIATRLTSDHVVAVRERLDGVAADASIRYHERAGVLVVHGPEFERPALNASVGIVTAGTSDAIPAGEAAAIVGEIGARVERIDDVGVAALTRLTDQLDRLRTHDVLIIAAGREGALPTVVAGLVDVPVIGLPVSTGYGHGGEGEAALSGMLQSCTALSAVNVDAGFTAGAQAGLIARRVHDARTD
jgi:NCAIR mutase (PurE)-related protein